MDEKKINTNKVAETVNGYNSGIGDKSDSNPPSVEVINEDNSDITCGYCGWKPEWLQIFNTPRFLLACVSWFTFTQGFVVNGIIYTNFTSWERRYSLSTTQVAWISSSYDLAAAVFTLLFGYIGQWMHNGRILCIGAYFMSIGSFIMSMPHLISGYYELGPQPIEICNLDENQTIPECTLEGSSYYGYFIIAQCFHAVGGAAVYTLAIPYMDDQVKTKNTPMYIGIMQGFAALGPALGYIFGGLFLNIYVDINNADNVEITPEDPRWVGAWWIGLTYSGFASLTVAFLIGCFPRELPSGRKYKEERISEAYKGKGLTETERKDYGKSLSDLLFTLKAIFTNPVWICLTISGIVESGAIIGLAAFLPKIMQFQFALPPAKAAAYAGAVVVPGAAGGQVLGGLIPRWLNLRMRGLLIQCLVCSVIAMAISFAFLIRCETIPISGVTVPYFNGSVEIEDSAVDVAHPCNTACNCTTESYDPVCGSDGVEYFSPCHGGCPSTYEDIENGETMYTNCSCILLDNAPDNVIDGWATEGICSSDCKSFLIFLPFFFTLCLVTFVSATAGQAAVIRCVPDKQRAFAYGVQRTLVRLLGNVPGAIAIGAVFDTSCIIMQEKCDGSGSCWIYDTQFISEGITWACIIVKTVSALGFLLSLLLYKPPPAGEQEVQEVKPEVNTGTVTQQIQLSDNKHNDGNTIGKSGCAEGNGSTGYGNHGFTNVSTDWTKM